MFCKKHCSFFVKKKRSFFFSSEKVWKRRMLWMPFFYNNDLHCFFLFCKKHCSLFVKKKIFFFFSSEKVWKRRMLWTPFAPLWFTLFFVALQKTLQFVCETKKRTYGGLGPLFLPLWFTLFFILQKTLQFVCEKKKTFFFSSEKVCFGRMHYDLRSFLFCKKYCSLVVKKKMANGCFWNQNYWKTLGLKKTQFCVSET